MEKGGKAEQKQTDEIEDVCHLFRMEVLHQGERSPQEVPQGILRVRKGAELDEYDRAEGELCKGF